MMDRLPQELRDHILSYACLVEADINDDYNVNIRYIDDEGTKRPLYRTSASIKEQSRAVLDLATFCSLQLVSHRFQEETDGIFNSLIKHTFAEPSMVGPYEFLGPVVSSATPPPWMVITDELADALRGLSIIRCADIGIGPGCPWINSFLPGAFTLRCSVTLATPDETYKLYWNYKHEHHMLFRSDEITAAVESTIIRCVQQILDAVFTDGQKDKGMTAEKLQDIVEAFQA